MPLNLTAKQRIERAVAKSDLDCWVWQRGKNRDGYGLIRFDYVRHLAHRFTYELYRAPIPEGLDLDHLCHSNDLLCQGGISCLHRSCVNPWHMEPVTRGENLLRGEHPNMVTHREGVCGDGHPLTEDNISRRSDGRLRCRKCVNRRARESRARKTKARGLA